MADSTRRAYRTGENHFARFCCQRRLTPLPASEHLLAGFCAALALEGKAYSRIKSYLAGVRHWQVVSGMGDPFAAAHPQLDLVLRGIKRHQGCPAPDRRLPITPTILRLLRNAWTASADSWEAKKLWAACCCGFLGFSRSGEFVVGRPFDPLRHLSAFDVAVDSWTSPSLVGLGLKQSKTDPFRQGVAIYMGRTDTDLCPVGALLSYLACRGWRPGALFCYEDGRPLSGARLLESVCRALESQGVQAANFSGHSFRIGAASTAAVRGFEDSTIRTLGR